MLGIPDPWVAAAFILCGLSALACLVYGVLNWNRGDDSVSEVDRQWAEQEEKIEETL